MEVYVLLGLVSLGYMFTNKNNRDAEVAPETLAAASKEREMPMHRRYQNSKTYNDVRTEEMLRAQDSERAAKYPMRTGAVDPRSRAYASNVLDGPVKSELAGTEFSAADFRHNNMQPFFGGKLTSARTDADTGALLERFTGAPGVGNSLSKSEVPSLFAPEERTEATNVYGNQVATTEIHDRFGELNSVNRVKNNELPFEQVRVGPGVGQGYTSTGAGGFGHNEDRQHVMGYYKTVNELRPGNRPKDVFEGRANAGAVPGGSRGLLGQVSKNLPDTAFNIEDFGMVPTTGQAEANAVRPDPQHGRKLRNPPTTFRVEGAGPTGDMAPAMPREEGISNKIGEPKLRQETPDLTGAGRAGIGNKASEDVLRLPNALDSNERTSYDDRWSSVRMMNMRSTYPGGDVRAHVDGGLRMTSRDHTADASASHAWGVMAPQAPSRGPAYDPLLHRPRTTLKETQIHDSRTGNYKNEHGVVADEGETTRRTIREGFSDTYETMHVRNPHGYTVQEGVGAPGANPRNHDLKTTVKQITGRTDYMGVVSPGEYVPEGGYSVDAMGREEARLTNRQFTEQNEYYGSGGRPSETGYATTHNAMQKTLTTANNKHDFEYYGISKPSTEKGVDMEHVYATTLNEAKQSLLTNRVPGGHAGPKRSPVAGLQGDVYTKDIVYSKDYVGNPDNMPKARGEEGSIAVQANTGLSHGDRIDDQLLTWLNSNPLVTSPVGDLHKSSINSPQIS